jgi:Helix-turn-helix domain
MNHSFYVTITARILLNKDLTDKQKILLALISNLSNERGYCFASNEYLANCLNCSVTSVRDNLRLLEKGGYIGRVLKLNEKMEVEYRSITLCFENPMPTSQHTPDGKSSYPPDGNPSHNIQLDKIQLDNYINKEYDAKSAFVSRLNDFKDKLGSQYQPFIDYWTETNKKGKMRYEGEKYFAIERRINTWLNRSNYFDKYQTESINTPKIKLK